MWRSMLKCHQKQFQAVMESKTRALRANTGFQRDSSLRATLELEVQLLSWCSHFNDWICSQKSYVESLNGWLLRCLKYEQEETPDDRPSLLVVLELLQFLQLWERQDEERRQRIKVEYLSKDYKKRLTMLQQKRGRARARCEALENFTSEALRAHEQA
ncbi:hypothetical protein HAX54_045575 [Datura stramonium]|uniref:DUF632 domain-containing protein n=1 Tax=Datura stramonium TaxID=4076 RepID=A0ABS8SRW7_DATST|nr:hypothetical protein [Datura stramonium]